ncbi:hypothetical protein [Paenarthrobacter sp. NPDC058040]|uniref:hypothetical protein n=1 Tax=unclassified Paenarthrobacter TaxID=2634190 RepID=UPI0036D8CA8B
MSLEAWSVALDRLEADIALAVSGGFPAPWEPPADLGPLPVALGARALLVLDAQADAMDLVSGMKHDAGAHLAALAAVSPGPGSARPLLLDVRG